MNLTPSQRKALDLLIRQGGVRYGTQISAMRDLKSMGLCSAHDTGKKGAGRWVWRPTARASALVAAARENSK